MLAKESLTIPKRERLFSFEPEREGFLPLEISNTARIYADEGLAQVRLVEPDKECEISYVDKQVKYQKQDAIAVQRL
jgi:dCTP deaminase